MNIAKQAHKVYIIMGPSGSGKTSIVRALKEYGVHEHVSCTTRKPRKGEVYGDHYYFVTHDEFNRLDMLESVTHSGNQYGITKTEFLRNLAKYPVSAIVTELQGCKQIQQAFPEVVTSIFIRTNREEAMARMKARGDSLDNIIKRLTYDDEHDVWNNWVHADYVVDNILLEQAIDDTMFIMDINNCKTFKAS